MERSRRRAAVAVAAVALAALVGAVPASQAQVPPLLGGSSTTSTTAAPAPPSSPASPVPDGGRLSAGAESAPSGAEDARGDGAPPPAGGIAVPPEARRIIESVQRTGPSDSGPLVAKLAELHALGLSEAEGYRVGMGRFPIAGRARYSHDWLYPRYGPGFRFHLGTDVFADYGTPVRAPVDGVATSANGGLGGLTVKVTMPDGTYFYLAHLSGLVEGFVNGMAVRTGDIVGYVGDSGNARGGAPHLHIGIYPYGGDPVDPKPILDRFLAEAQALLPQVVEAVRASSSPPAPSVPAAPALESTAGRARRPMLASGRTELPAEVLYLLGTNPFEGPRALVDLAVSDLAAEIDWSAR